MADCPDFINKVIEKSEGFSGAQMQELCTQMALKNFWENKDEDNQDGKVMANYDKEKLIEKDNMYNKRLEKKKK